LAEASRWSRRRQSSQLAGGGLQDSQVDDLARLDARPLQNDRALSLANPAVGAAELVATLDQDLSRSSDPLGRLA
jgi:hypothetical protein